MNADEAYKLTPCKAHGGTSDEVDDCDGCAYDRAFDAVPDPWRDVHTFPERRLAPVVIAIATGVVCFLWWLAIFGW